MSHTVKRGETLSKIAKANGITLAQLLDANPQFKSHPDIVQIGDVLITPGDEAVPPSQPVPAPSPFARRLASVAHEQHDRFRFVNEADPQLCGQIKKWTQDIGSTFVSCTSNDHPWSAVFVSWCVKKRAPPVRSSLFQSGTRCSSIARFRMRSMEGACSTVLRSPSTPRTWATSFRTIVAAPGSRSIMREHTRNTNPTR